jgi:hypothetical protein
MLDWMKASKCGPKATDVVFINANVRFSPAKLPIFHNNSKSRTLSFTRQPTKKTFGRRQETKKCGEMFLVVSKKNAKSGLPIR